MLLGAIWSNLAYCWVMSTKGPFEGIYSINVVKNAQKALEYHGVFWGLFSKIQLHKPKNYGTIISDLVCGKFALNWLANYGSEDSRRR